jgi:hypothetical protein
MMMSNGGGQPFSRLMMMSNGGGQKVMGGQKAKPFEEKEFDLLTLHF